jgi:hypothetical protein
MYFFKSINNSNTDPIYERYIFVAMLTALLQANIRLAT